MRACLYVCVVRETDRARPAHVFALSTNASACVCVCVCVCVRVWVGGWTCPCTPSATGHIEHNPRYPSHHPSRHRRPLPLVLYTRTRTHAHTQTRPTPTHLPHRTAAAAASTRLRARRAPQAQSRTRSTGRRCGHVWAYVRVCVGPNISLPLLAPTLTLSHPLPLSLLGSSLAPGLHGCD